MNNIYTYLHELTFLAQKAAMIHRIVYDCCLFHLTLKINFNQFIRLISASSLLLCTMATSKSIFQSVEYWTTPDPCYTSVIT